MSDCASVDADGVQQSAECAASTTSHRSHKSASVGGEASAAKHGSVEARAAEQYVLGWDLQNK
jgi:hypothetical protein